MDILMGVQFAKETGVFAFIGRRDRNFHGILSRFVDYCWTVDSENNSYLWLWRWLIVSTSMKLYGQPLHSNLTGLNNLFMVPLDWPRRNIKVYASLPHYTSKCTYLAVTIQWNSESSGITEVLSRGAVSDVSKKSQNWSKRGTDLGTSSLWSRWVYHLTLSSPINIHVLFRVYTLVYTFCFLFFYLFLYFSFQRVLCRSVCTRVCIYVYVSVCMCMCRVYNMC